MFRNLHVCVSSEEMMLNVTSTFQAGARVSQHVPAVEPELILV